MLWELTTGLLSFQGMSPVQATYAVYANNASPPLSSTYPPAINSLIERCWSAKPAKRPRFSHIVSVLETYDRYLREGLPMLSPPPLSPLASFLGVFKITPCTSTTLPIMPDRRVQA
ncbi:hypothetical protein ABZP36_022956 [Zizania latifolia]